VLEGYPFFAGSKGDMCQGLMAVEFDLMMRVELI
jgi:hypothetical protein